MLIFKNGDYNVKSMEFILQEDWRGRGYALYAGD